MISFDDVGGTIKSKSKYIISWRNLSEYEKYAFKEYHQFFKEEPDSLDLESWIKQRGFDGVCDWLDDSYFKMTETLRELVYENRI
jgi:hypothetical protein